MSRLSFIFLVCILCSDSTAQAHHVEQRALALYDAPRDRQIPLAIYAGDVKAHLPVVILNHGYTVKNTEYSFLANALAQQGYYVVSIQHDLQDDPLLPKTGNLFEKRKPFWLRNVQNILHTLSALKEMDPTLNVEKVILIGHSNGGDSAMMFATQYPKRVAHVISLDSLRHPFPTKDRIPILTLRAHDTKADAGVLPKSGVTIIHMQNIKHIDFCDRGPSQVKKEVIQAIMKFLNEAS